ncbi:tetratricopeptide repeat protein [Candidatus Sumerlaeota bacterium]|nr:tetratricopeptide repeat protein [Candidatus Sumerlaeota bacterium]
MNWTQRNKSGGLWMNQIGLLVLLCAVLCAAGCDRRTPEEKLREAQGYLQQHDFQNCIIICENILETTAPNDPLAKEANLMRAQCLLYSNPEQALEIIKKLMEDEGYAPPRTLQLLDMMMRAYMSPSSMTTEQPDLHEQGRQALNALDQFEEELKTRGLLEHPQYMTLPFLRAQVLHQAGDTDAAIEIFRTVAYDDNTTPLGPGQFVEPQSEHEMKMQVVLNAVMIASRVLFDEGRTTESLQYMEDYLAQKQDSPVRRDVTLQLASLYRGTGNVEKSDEHLDRALELYDRDIDAALGADYKVYLMTLKANAMRAVGMRFEDALAVYEGILKDYPSSNRIPAVKMAMAETIYGKGDLENALSMYQALVAEYEGTQVGEAASRWVMGIQNEMASMQQGANADELTTASATMNLDAQTTGGEALGDDTGTTTGR